ncbi:biotin transporter BioY [Acrocarpospora catenulata]|uniref:biotin transporter BioY n=1 Tax=Acrocarpospora catenulata TaxID=2836182 RepID=UPI001BDA6B5D|nr:biotin transporter BioY [Acrocarpospora catenulata]
MTSATTGARPAVLSDLIPGRLVRDTALVVGAAALTGVAAQISFPLPDTPVPVTLQTLAVLLSGAALGLHRAFLGMVLYFLVGQVSDLAGLGLTWFAPSGGNATLGYILGFIVAASLVGHLAARGGDRTVARTVGTMLAGTLTIYAVGVPWLMVYTGMDLATAVDKGVVPFLAGDTVKLVVAAGLLPATWKLLGGGAKVEE